MAFSSQLLRLHQNPPCFYTQTRLWSHAKKSTAGHHQCPPKLDFRSIIPNITMPARNTYHTIQLVIQTIAVQAIYSCANSKRVQLIFEILYQSFSYHQRVTDAEMTDNEYITHILSATLWKWWRGLGCRSKAFRPVCFSWGIVVTWCRPITKLASAAVVIPTRMKLM